MAPLIAGAWVLIVVAAFVAGHEMRKLEQKPEGTPADVAAALQLITDEGLLSAEQHEDLWRVYVTRVRAA